VAYDSGPQTFIAEPTLSPEPDVRFIPDEPFGVIDADSFADEAAPTAPRAAAPSAPPAESTGEDFYVEAEEQITPELIEVTPEESASLSAPPPPGDSASTVMFRADALPWAQPTGEVPLVERARAAAEPLETMEEPVLEEVFDEGAMTTLPSIEPISSPATPGGPAAAPTPAPRYERSVATAWETFQPQPPSEPAPARAPEPAARAPEPSERRAEPKALHAEPPARPPEPAASPPEPPARPLAPPPRTLEMVSPSPLPGPPPAAEPKAPPAARVEAPPAAPAEAPNPASFADLNAAVREAVKPAVASVAAEVAVPIDMVEKIAQRVVAQISEKVIQQIAWEVIPDLAEAMIKREIERLKAELQQI
jgi:hypothetical protein